MRKTFDPLFNLNKENLDTRTTLYFFKELHFAQGQRIVNAKFCLPVAAEEIFYGAHDGGMVDQSS